MPVVCATMKDDPIHIGTQGGLNVYLEPPEPDLVSFDYLLARFYREVVSTVEIQRPLAMVLNPEADGKVLYQHMDVWLLLYRARYRIQVERGPRASINGPHSVRLYYQSWQIPTEIYWLASAQIVDTMFYNQEGIIGNLNLIIAERGFYHSERTGKQSATK